MKEAEQTKEHYLPPIHDEEVDLKQLSVDGEELLHALVQEGDSAEDVYDRFNHFAELLMRYMRRFAKCARSLKCSTKSFLSATAEILSKASLRALKGR